MKSLFTLSQFFILPLCLALTISGCNKSAPETEASETEVQETAPETTRLEKPALPSWTFSRDMVFPGNRSLTRPEDGVILPDGRLVVSDQLVGLRLLNADGSSRPFGKFPEAGYVHNPPAIESGANGVTLDPTETFLLVADVYQGGIYRVNLATEGTEKIYQHNFGVNMARADSLGGIWFTQSTRNRPRENSAGLWEGVDRPVADGALCYIAPGAKEAIVLADGFFFTNGLVLNEKAGLLYMAETMGSRVWQFTMDIEAGTVSDRTLAFNINFPDNLELDRYGRLWVACPLHSEIVVADPETGSVQSVFRISTPQSKRLIAEIETRLANQQLWLELANRELWFPAPALITGMVLDLENGTVYATGLGNAILKLEE